MGTLTTRVNGNLVTTTHDTSGNYGIAVNDSREQIAQTISYAMIDAAFGYNEAHSLNYVMVRGAQSKVRSLEAYVRIMHESY